MHRPTISIGAGFVLAGSAAFIVQAAGDDAASATVTSGDFNGFVEGADLDIGGHAWMVRTGDEHTVVLIHITGLEAGTEYATHIHAAACGVDDADGHYMNDPDGAAEPPNEIWPGPVTADSDGVAHGYTEADFVAGDDAVSVVVHRPGDTPNKIACADLG